MPSKIIYTLTDEAPALATTSLLPILQAFLKEGNIEIETKDISLAARILSAFPTFLSPAQQKNDDLADLDSLTNEKDANIIKLPNISASIPQLQEAIKELQSNNYSLPNYPVTPSNDEEREIKKRYDAIKGSAVNPVLRKGNSDRRAPEPVKAFAQKNPHTMGAWSPESQTHVASMTEGDFYHTEKSKTLTKKDELKIVWENQQGKQKTLKEKIAVSQNEIIDTAVMSHSSLKKYAQKEIANAKNEKVLLSLHLKATMMKVSDPIIFGSITQVFFEEFIEEFKEELQKIDFNPNNGMGDLEQKWATLDSALQHKMKQSLEALYRQQPELAMVNSDKGITNLHFPNDIIIDASMPAMIRSSGKMYNKNGTLQDTKALIPDRSYAGVYQAVIEDCKKHGAYDPTTLGTVPNVGLMAKKAEEYGSHDKTFQIQEAGVVKVLNAQNEVILEQKVEKNDIFRMGAVRDEAIVDWIQLALTRGKETGWPVVFWLDSQRSHDREIIKKVTHFLKENSINNESIKILNPIDATKYTLERMRKGENTLSVTGNVLRDYLTDLFPIIELGTSAKMLSIVPLMNGGGLFETGAGGSAPKHVQQFVEEGHLRWDSLGEFMALAPSLSHYSKVNNNTTAQVFADTLNAAIVTFLLENKSPSRVVNEIDNRGSHYYLALYWAEALAKSKIETNLQVKFQKLAEALRKNEETINEELLKAQGEKMDLGGYYFPNLEKVLNAMRPSHTFNTIIDSF